MSTQVITISSRVPHESYYFLTQFLESCKRQKIDPVFLQGEWRGLLSKPKLLHLHLRTSLTQYTIAVDAWDAIFTTGTDDIIERFKTFNVPIVFNAERSCFPRSDLANKFPESPTPYRYLNSGFFVGYTEAIISMLEDMKLDTLADDHVKPDGTKHEPNDQENYQVWYLANQSKAALDNQALICQSLHASEPNEFRLENGTIKSLLTHNFPAVFHGNGSGKEWLKRIIDFLHI